MRVKLGGLNNITVAPIPKLIANMSYMTYINCSLSSEDKPLVWMDTEVKSPPFSGQARLEAGFLLSPHYS